MICPVLVSLVVALVGITIVGLSVRAAVTSGRLELVAWLGLAMVGMILSTGGGFGVGFYLFGGAS